MKAIVHIGTEKTGTTSIQQFLFQNKRRLKSAGFHFIQSAGDRNNRAIPSYCVNDNRFDDFFRNNGIITLDQRKAFKAKFREEFENELASLSDSIHTVVISSEHFHSRIRTLEEMDRVHKFLTSYFDEFKIVCYLRDQATTCASYYSTHLKSGGESTFQEFLERCKPGNYYFNYSELLSNWDRCFGREAMCVRLFGREHFVSGDLLEDFTHILDPNLVGKLDKKIQIENESLTPGGQALVRAVNMAFPLRTATAEGAKLREKCKKMVFEKLKGRGRDLDAGTLREIYDSFLVANERVRERYFPDRRELFSVPTTGREVVVNLDERFIDAQTAVLNALKKAGPSVVSSDALVTICGGIAESLAEMQDDGGEEEGTAVENAKAMLQVVEPQQESPPPKKPKKQAMGGEVLSLAAFGYHKTNIELAVRLMSLAVELNPNAQAARELLKQYEKLADEPVKSLFQVTYTFDSSDWDKDIDGKNVFELVRLWMGSFADRAVGESLNFLTDAKNVLSDGMAEPIAEERSGSAYVVFEESSEEKALLVAQACPLLLLGRRVELAHLGRMGRHLRMRKMQAAESARGVS